MVSATWPTNVSYYYVIKTPHSWCIGHHLAYRGHSVHSGWVYKAWGEICDVIACGDICVWGHESKLQKLQKMLKYSQWWIQFSSIKMSHCGHASMACLQSEMFKECRRCSLWSYFKDQMLALKEKKKRFCQQNTWLLRWPMLSRPMQTVHGESPTSRRKQIWEIYENILAVFMLKIFQDLK